ncbi:MAG: DUF309 domain-containing protein [Terriglobales bacterium]
MPDEPKVAAGAPFRLGITLFNARRFFEAHEALEDAWRESPRGSAQRRHLQGMCQLAVAFHHLSRENFTGARSVLARGLGNLVGAEESFPDLDLPRLRTNLAEWQRHLAGGAAGSECPKWPRIEAQWRKAVQRPRKSKA